MRVTPRLPNHVNPPIFHSPFPVYLLRLDETGTPSYVGRGDSLSRPSTLSRESIGVGTSNSSILNSYFPVFPLDSHPTLPHNGTYVRYKRPTGRNNRINGAEAAHNRRHRPREDRRRPPHHRLLHRRHDGQDRRRRALPQDRRRQTARKVRVQGRRRVPCQIQRRPMRPLNPWTPQPGRPLLRRGKDPGGRDPERPARPYERLPHCTSLG